MITSLFAEGGLWLTNERGECNEKTLEMVIERKQEADVTADMEEGGWGYFYFIF